MFRQRIFSVLFFVFATIIFLSSAAKVRANCMPYTSSNLELVEGNCDEKTYDCKNGAANEYFNAADCENVDGCYEVHRIVSQNLTTRLCYFKIGAVRPGDPNECGWSGRDCCPAPAAQCRITTLECKENKCVGTTPPVTLPFILCDSVPAGNKRDECKACVGEQNGEDAKKIWTAIGCISVDPADGKNGGSIITALIRIGLGFAGGALLLMILASAFLLSTSQGDPKRTQEAQQMITSGITGLLFILFSIVILRTIGVDILQIPGF